MMRCLARSPDALTGAGRATADKRLFEIGDTLPARLATSPLPLHAMSSSPARASLCRATRYDAREKPRRRVSSSYHFRCGRRQAVDADERLRR